MGMFKSIEEKREFEEQMRFTQGVIKDIQAVCSKGKILKIRYGLACDDDLIESIIYEELSLRSRYNYLVKLARENGIKLNKKCIFLKWDSEDE